VPVSASPMLPHWSQMNSENSQASRVKYVQLVLFHNSNAIRMGYNRASDTGLLRNFEVTKTDVRYQSGKHADRPRITPDATSMALNRSARG
jgi:hypothetical protein